MALDSSATDCAVVRFRDGVDGAFERGAAFLSMINRRFPFFLVFQVNASRACLQEKKKKGQ